MALDRNKKRTYKNKHKTEAKMAVVKDFLALVSILAFTGSALTVMDVATRVI